MFIEVTYGLFEHFFTNAEAFILQNSSGGLGLIFPLLMLGVFYFFFMRPQMKKQKEQGAFANELKKGDEVVTASGIIGQLNKIEDNIVTLEIYQWYIQNSQ